MLVLQAFAASGNGVAPPEFKFSGATAIAILMRVERVHWMEAQDPLSQAASASGSEDDESSNFGSGVVPGKPIIHLRYAPTRVKPCLWPADSDGCVTALRCYIAHAGDCRAVLSHGGQAVDMTEDHKPSMRPDEMVSEP